VYLRIVGGVPVRVDREALKMAIADPSVHASLRVVAPGSLDGTVADSARPEFLAEPRAGVDLPPTIGQWARR
jgi:hypothetical protein